MSVWEEEGWVPAQTVDMDHEIFKFLKLREQLKNLKEEDMKELHVEFLDELYFRWNEHRKRNEWFWNPDLEHLEGDGNAYYDSGPRIVYPFFNDTGTRVNKLRF